MASQPRIPVHVVRPLRFLQLAALVLTAALAAPAMPLPGGAAAAQIGNIRANVGVTFSPEIQERLAQGTIRLGDAIRGGLVIASDGERPMEVVLVAGYLRDGEVVASELSRPLRLATDPARRGGRGIGETEKNLVLPGTDRPVRQMYPVPAWLFRFPAPEGGVRGGARGPVIASVDSLDNITQPVFVTIPGWITFDRGGESFDLGIYAGGAWIQRDLERSGAAAKLNWERYEALYLLPIPTDPEARQQAQGQALVIPFIPER